MSCPSSEHPDSLSLIAYLRGSLSSDVARSVHRHSMLCDRCSSELEAMARLRHGVGLDIPLELRLALAAPLTAQ